MIVNRYVKINVIGKWIFGNDKPSEVLIEHYCTSLGYIAKNHS